MLEHKFLHDGWRPKRLRSLNNHLLTLFKPRHHVIFFVLIKISETNIEDLNDKSWVKQIPIDALDSFWLQGRELFFDIVKVLFMLLLFAFYRFRYQIDIFDKSSMVVSHETGLELVQAFDLFHVVLWISFLSQRRIDCQHLTRCHAVLLLD